MDSKPHNVKPKKGSKKIKSVSGDRKADVLVVPPDILKKLGINIGNNSTPPIANGMEINGCLATNIVPSSYDSKSSESSIQQTASLMKKSVFLSPTFIHTVANVIPGEIEFSNKSIDESEINKISLSENTEGLTVDQHEIHQNCNGAVLKCDLVTSVPIDYENTNGGSCEIAANENNLGVEEDNIESEIIFPQGNSVGVEEDIATTQQDKIVNNFTSPILVHTHTIGAANNILESDHMKIVVPCEKQNENFITSFENGVTEKGCSVGNTSLHNNMRDVADTDPEMREISSLKLKSTNHPQFENVNNVTSLSNKVIVSKETDILNIPFIEEGIVEMEEPENMKKIMLLENNINFIVDATIDTCQILCHQNAAKTDQMDASGTFVSSGIINQIIPLELENNVLILEKNTSQSNDTNFVDETVSSSVNTNLFCHSELQKVTTQQDFVSVSQTNNNDIFTEVNVQQDIILGDNIGLVHSNTKTENLENNIPDKTENVIEKNAEIMKKRDPKITIISQETISSADCKESRKAQLSFVNTLTPIPLNTIICSSKQNSAVPCNNVYLQSCSGTVNECVASDPTCLDVCSNKLLKTSILEASNNKTDLEVKMTAKNASVIIVDAINDSKRNGLKLDGNVESKDQGIMESLKDTVMEESTVQYSFNSSILPSNLIKNDTSISNNLSIVCDKSNLPGKILDDHINLNTEFNIIKYKNNLTRIVTNESTKRNNEKTVIKDKNDIHKVTDYEYVNYYDEELNRILKSAKENSNANTQVDKVKEIAGYIKKIAEKNRRKRITEYSEGTNNKRQSINSKTNMTTSKLCIQGVEKPGGNKNNIENSGETKVLKTYSRRNQKQVSRKLVDTSDTKVPVTYNTSNALSNEMNIADILISTRTKTQNFCICYDFGHLYDCDNAYEHLHFCLHNGSVDLETVLEIYNEDDSIYGDRTQLPNQKISEMPDENVALNICWNYFTNDLYECNTNVSKKNTLASGCDLSETKDNLYIIEKRENKAEGNISHKITDEKDKSIIKSTPILNNVDTQEISQVTDRQTGGLQSDDNINLSSTISKIQQEKSVNTGALSAGSRIDTASIEHKPTEGSKSDEENLIPQKSDTVEPQQNVEPNIITEINSCNQEKYETCKKNDPEVESISVESSNKKKLKRTHPVREAKDTRVSHGTPPSKKNIKCGVCNQLLFESEWEQHAKNQHCHIAWRAGSSFNFDDSDLIKKIRKRLEDVGNLSCSYCDTRYKNMKKFMTHVKQCLGKQDTSRRRTSLNKDTVVCGVCHETVQYLSWIDHIERDHNYLAWIDGQKVLNIKDEDAVAKHLQNIIKVNGVLVCHKCGFKRQRFKLYLEHIQNCDGSQAHHNESLTSKHLAEVIPEQDADLPSSSDENVTCGVCKQLVPTLKWTEHIAKEHNYLAWEDGSAPLNTDDKDAVRNHLQQFIRESKSGLICYKCGLSRRRVHLYLSHIETCDGVGVDMEESQDVSMAESQDVSMAESQDVSMAESQDVSMAESQDVSMADESISGEKQAECGVCNAVVSMSDWNEHIGREHNYLAWQVGCTPLDEDDEDAVKEHLLAISKSESLICYKCGIKRKQVKRYLSHIENCNGSRNSLNETTESVDVRQGTEEQSGTATDEPDMIVKCAVCNEDVPNKKWIEHSGKEHQYLAWQQGQEPLKLDCQDSIRMHLLNTSKANNGLICYKCDTVKKYPKTFQIHIKECKQSANKTFNDSIDSVDVKCETEGQIDTDPNNSDMIVKCAVCNEDVPNRKWMEHIGKEHQYLAWQHGQEPLKLKNEDSIKIHLLNMSKANNGLICYNCDTVKRYPKVFQNHIKECMSANNDSEKPCEESSESDDKPCESVIKMEIVEETGKIVKCGVCDQDVLDKKWFEHIGNEHRYLAWQQGQEKLDITDEEEVQRHLTELSKRTGGLICNKCGLVRKYPKVFLEHVKNCKSIVARLSAGSDTVECSVCSEKVNRKDWDAHAMDKHYNVAWIVGDTPINFNSPYEVEPYIKKYWKKRGKLVCKTCSMSRVSAVGFYAHIITCGKTEEETDIYKDVCEICNNKYLLVYKNQHMRGHKERDIAIERKLILEKEKKIKEEKMDLPVEIVGGRRKAATKALTVIGKYTSNNDNGCPKCNFHSDDQDEMANHVCVGKVFEESDSEVDMDLNQSSEEDDESDVDSKVSEEERELQNAEDDDEDDDQDSEQTSTKKHDSSRIQRIPFQIKNANSYMKKSAEDFVKFHLTDADLFEEYRKIQYEIVSEDDLKNYMPPLEESCKISYDSSEWVVFKRFESSRRKDVITMFTGSCIHSICWVPSHINDSPAEHEYLCVITHLGTDTPRHLWYEKPAPAPSLVQIWDCGNTIQDPPELVMAIAIDYGTIWALDWCPSGARDVLNTADDSCHELSRLGLFAAACSDGNAYVFAMPYPSTIENKGQVFCKLTPILELRYGRDRQAFQATAIKWSTQKGHGHIVVGYGDGSTAYFDLKNESPMLKAEKNGITVLYPYYDERAQQLCVEEVDTFPVRAAGGGAGGVAAGSVGGGGLAGGAGPAGRALLYSHSAAPRVKFPPHWPAPLLAGDDNLLSQAVNELEWWSGGGAGGRRLGGMRACGACASCGRVAQAATPLLRVMRLHPAYTDTHKQIIGVIQMVPFNSKRKIKNDDESMLVEPLTYNDAVAKYGIQFERIWSKDRIVQRKLSEMSRQIYPERFPLADIVSLEFCSSSRHHNKLALATHSGFVFIVNVC